MGDQAALILVIVIGGIGLGIGVAIGYVLARGLGGQENQTGQGGNLMELVRLWRNKRSGKLVLEVRGKYFENSSGLPEKSRLGLVDLAVELQSWVNLIPPATYQSTPPIASGVAGEKGVPAPVQAVGAVLTADAVVDALRAEVQTAPAPGEYIQPVSLASAPKGTASVQVTKSPVVAVAAVETNEPVKPVSTNLGDILARTLNPGKSKEAPVIKSIAAQIDEIVQERLPESEVSSHYIKLLEIPERGLVVVVDNWQYEGVNEVADPEIQKFLRECVAEWEQRSS